MTAQMHSSKSVYRRKKHIARASDAASNEKFYGDDKELASPSGV